MATTVPTGYASAAEPTAEFTGLFERFLESNPGQVLPGIDGNYVQPNSLRRI